MVSVFLDHPSSLAHDTGPHPEQPARIVAIERELAARAWLGFERVRSPAVDRATLADVASRFDWWTAKMYEIDPPGRNHGILLGTRGWTAGGQSSRRQVSGSTEEEN